MKKIFRLLFLLPFAFLVAGPVILLFTGMFMGNREIQECLSPVIEREGGYAVWRLVPHYPTLRNVVELFLDTPEFFQMFWNSAIMAGGILSGQLLFGAPAAWGLARYPFRGRKLVYMLYVLMMMMPFQVTMLSQYFILDAMQLLDTRAAMILPGMFSAFSVFLMYRFFCSIPESILDAARIDGAGEFQIFLRIGIPLGASGILSALTLSFLECWNMVEQPLAFLKSKNLWPLSLFLPEINGQNAGVSFCASFMTLLPAIFVFLAGKDYMEQGIAGFAEKE